MSWSAAQKRMETARKREEWASLKQQRELEWMHKEQSKHSTAEAARLEVEVFEKSLDVLLSIHKHARPKFDWIELLASLPPHPPALSVEGAESATLMAAFAPEHGEWRKMRSLAKRVLAGDAAAYHEAYTELSGLVELSTLGTAIAFRVHNAKLVECELRVNGHDAIPADVKSLTAAGKVSVKTMPKARFHELYQDYVCACVLRVAREVLALLPVDAVIVTATVTAVQTSTGTEGSIPVLSVAMPRHAVEQLDFARLDPSDSMKNFAHRGDVMASRKSGGFMTIVPLKPSDVAGGEIFKPDLAGALDRIRKMRAEISARSQSLRRTTLSPEEPALPPT